MRENQDAFLTVEELCDILKIGRNAVYRLLNAGEIKGLRNGRVWRIPKVSVIAYTKEKTKLFE